MTYILRDVPEGLWRRVKARASRDGWPLRALILQLLEDFAIERVTPGGSPPMPGKAGAPAADVPSSYGPIVVVTQRAPRQELRLAGGASAIDTPTELIVLDREQRPIARFPKANVESWYVEDIRP